MNIKNEIMLRQRNFLGGVASGALVVLLGQGLYGCAANEIRVVNEGLFGTSFPRYKVGSFDEAEKQMQRLALTSPQEDKWIAYTEGDKIIVQDIGEKPEDVNDPDAPLLQGSYLSIHTNTGLEERTLKKLPPGTRVKYYHIHPFEKNEEVDDEFLNSAKPSDDDFTSQAVRQMRMKKDYPHLVLEPSSVVAVRHAADYWVSDEMLTKFQESLKTGNNRIAITYLDASSRWVISKWETEEPRSVQEFLNTLNEKGLHTNIRELK